MKNVYFRDLASEIMLCDMFFSGMDCNIGGHKWHINMNMSNHMTCETSEFEVVEDHIKRHTISLDGKTFPMHIGKKKFNIEINKSLYQTINYNPMKPLVRTRMFDVRLKTKTTNTCNYLAIVSIDDGVRPPEFSYYFANWVVPNERLCCSVNSPDYSCALNGIVFNYHNCRFLVYNHNQIGSNSKQFLVVESLDPIDCKDFRVAVRRVLVVIGFITGNYCFGPFWIFNATMHKFISYSDSMCKGGIAKYQMFSLNPYEYYSEADKRPDIGKTIEDQLKPVTRIQLEKLLVMLDDPKFSHLFFVFQDLILNVSSVMAETKLPIYAACLEMCKNWWKDHYKDDLKKSKTSLYNESERKDIYNKIVEILDKDYASNPDTEICKKKVWNIFQAANQDMLAEAFENVGVTLSKDEKSSLGLRNPILHGSDVIEAQFDEDDNTGYVDEIENKCFIYHALIWRFIMKVIGYEGMYIDVANLNKLFRSSASNNARPLMKKV